MAAQPTGIQSQERRDAHDPRRLFWLMLTAGLLGFIALARLTTYQTMTERGRGLVWEQWWRLRNDLPQIAWPAAMSVAYVLMLVVAGVGSLMALWLALHASDASEAEQATEAPGPEPAPRLPPDNVISQ